MEYARPRNVARRYTLLLVGGMLLALMGTSKAARADANDELIAKLTEAYTRGMALYNDERFTEATPQFEQAVRIAPLVYGRGQSGPENINTAKLSEFLANCYSEAFRLSEAEELYTRCAETARREEGANSPMVFRCQGNLALVCFRLNQWERAEQLFLASLSRRDPRDDWGVRANNLAYLYMTSDRHRAAEEWFRKSLEVWAGRNDRHSRLMTAQGRHGLGMAAYKQHRYPEAQALFEQALDVRQALLPADSRWVAQSQGMLASVLSSRGQDREAQRLAEQAEKAYRDRWGSEHVDVGLQLHELGLLLARQGVLPRAVAKLDESRRIYRAYLGGVLTGLSQPEQLRFLDEERHRFMDVVALARNHPDDARLVRASLEWALNEKGVVQQTLAERLLQARDAHRQPELAALLAELNEVRQSLAAIAAAGDEKQNRWNELTTQERDLERRLGRINQRQAAPAWVELSSVAQALPEESVLVQIVRVDRERPAVSAFGARPAHKPSYVAWTLRKRDARVQLFNLGPADTIDAQIATIRKTLGQANDTIRTLGEPEAERVLLEQLSALSRRVFQPLLPALEDARRLVLSPDGALWLVPWAALPTAEGRYAVEDYQISFAISGRELAATHTRLNGAGVIMANPNYDLAPAQAQSSLRAIYRGRSLPQIPQTRGIGKLSDLPHVAPLPGTADEAEAIKDSLARYVGQEPIVYQDQYALESMFRRLRQPTALVLSTHGFFLEDEHDHSGSAGQSQNNPLLRCGLLLAGCNVRDRAKEAGEDGILTGLEIVGTDLRGSDLVVLSACETGLGQVRNGEGVAGLRQAFQLAGANAVVSTLWLIPDKESALLMKAFFDNLAKGQAKAEALGNAQRAMLRFRRGRDGAAHPLYWAAYTVTGR